MPRNSKQTLPGTISLPFTESMSIVRTSRRPPRYTIVGNGVLEDTRLSWRAKGLHCYLMSKPDGWQVQVRQLVSASLEGRDAVYAALGELQAHGYAHRVEGRDSHGRIQGYDYVITEGEGDTTPLTGLPFTVKPPLVSTERSKKRKDKILDAFEQAWRAYPKRLGNNSKPAAEKAFRARVTSGVPATYLVGAAFDYAMFCDATGKWGTEFVMMASTFYGPGLRYDADWSLPGQAKAKAPETVQDKEESYAGRFV